MLVGTIRNEYKRLGQTQQQQPQRVGSAGFLPVCDRHAYWGMQVSALPDNEATAMGGASTTTQQCVNTYTSAEIANPIELYSGRLLFSWRRALTERARARVCAVRYQS